MVRFIDLGHQVFAYREGDPAISELGLIASFAWWDTVSDSFLRFSGDYAWESWEEFSESYDGSHSDIERFKGLFPAVWPPQSLQVREVKALERQADALAGIALTLDWLSRRGTAGPAV